MAFPGAPSSHPAEDSCFFATSFDLDSARVEWEETTLVVSVLSPPSGMDRTDIDVAFRHEFNLRRSELMVSSHFPEGFLVKFIFGRVRDSIMRKHRGSFKRDRLLIHFRLYRAVSHTYNTNFFNRVHLAVGGLPLFA